jgi:thiol reductant ABC exporter CydC subunit
MKRSGFSTWRPLLQVLRALGEYKPLLIATAVSGVLAQVCAVGAACAAAWLVARAVLGAGAGELTPAIVLLGANALGAGVCKWLELWFSHVYAFRAIAGLRLQAFDGLERMSPSGLLRRRTGDLTATVMSDIESLESIYAHQLPSVVVALVVPVSAVAALAFLAPVVGAFVGLMALLLGTVPTWLSARAHAQGKVLRAQLGELHAEVVDGVQGARELILFSHRDAFLERLLALGRSMLAAQLRYGRRAGVENAAADLIVAVTTVGTLVLTAREVVAGTVSRAAFPVAVILAGAVLASIVLVVSTSSVIGELRGCAARVISVIEAGSPVAERPGARPPSPSLHPVVRFEDVAFAYDAGAAEVLAGVDFAVNPGEMVALVGKSGAGKTTCLNLLLRFWDPASGRITVGGEDIREFTLAGLRGMIGVVPQDPYLFHTTIRENIRMARPTASDAEVEDAGGRAQLDEFVAWLPAGYDTEIAERGQSLSGGQRQRIAIARALLRDAPVLVLDEAVSHVDVENERLVQQALSELRQGRATLVIAHRLSTIRAADRVVMLADGRIVEAGRHQELMCGSHRYARLVAARNAPENGIPAWI